MSEFPLTVQKREREKSWTGTTEWWLLGVGGREVEEGSGEINGDGGRLDLAW